MKFLANALLLAAVAQAAVTPRRDRASRNVEARSPDPKLPYDPNTTPYCTWWYENTDNSVSCEAIPLYWYITNAQWKRWNPTIAESCDNYITGRSYCVEANDEPSQPDPVTTTTADAPVTTTPTTTKGTTNAPPTTTTTKPGNGITTPTPIQPGMVDNCDSFYKVQQGDGCDAIASSHGISSTQFYKWNPEVGDTCAGLYADVYVCISVIGQEPTPTTSKPDNGITTPTPIQPGMVSNCDSFYKVQQGEGCDAIASAHGISSAQFYKWNPKVGDTCSGLYADVYVCISVIGQDPTPTNPGNGITTPTPVREHMASNCNKFHYVESGENCDTITKEYGLSMSLFYKWNPDSGDDCRGLFAKTYVCVSVVGYTPPTPTKPANGITTPTPTQSGMTKSCKKFHYVQSGQTCVDITKKYGISTTQLIRWNPAAGSECRGLFANTYCCVAVL